MGAHTDSSSTLEGDVGGDINARGSLGYLVRLCLRKQTKVGCLTSFLFSAFGCTCVMERVPLIACGGQRPTFWSWFSPSTLWKESNSGHWADAQTALPAELCQQTPEFIL